MKQSIRHSTTRDIIVADMPWHHETWSDKGQGRTASSHYDVMKPADMLELKPLMQHAFPGDSLLFMWTTGPQMEFTLKLMKHWGWEFKTVAFTWIKFNASFNRTIRDGIATGNMLPLADQDIVDIVQKATFTGMGHWSRANAEYILVGKRGKAPLARVRKNIHSVIYAPRGAHSEKPDEANKRIELMVKRPQDECFELFARRQYKDWQCTGLELDGAPIGNALLLIGSGYRWKPGEFSDNNNGHTDGDSVSPSSIGEAV